MTRSEFNRLYTANYEVFKRFARVYLIDESQVEDVIQEVATRVLANEKVLAKASTKVEAFLSWFKSRISMHIRRHVWVNYLNEETIAHNSISLTSLTETKEEGYHQFDTDDSPSEETPLEAALKAGLASLLPIEHDVIVRRTAGIPWKEIHVPGRKRRGLEMAYRRGIKKLRLYLRSVGIEDASFVDSMTHETDQIAS